PPPKSPFRPRERSRDDRSCSGTLSEPSRIQPRASAWSTQSSQTRVSVPSGLSYGTRRSPRRSVRPQTAHEVSMSLRRISIIRGLRQGTPRGRVYRWLRATATPERVTPPVDSGQDLLGRPCSGSRLLECRTLEQSPRNRRNRAQTRSESDGRRLPGCAGRGSVPALRGGDTTAKTRRRIACTMLIAVTAAGAGFAPAG